MKMKKRKKEVVRSEKPEVDMERDLALYQTKNRRRRLLCRLTGTVGVLFVAAVAVCWFSGGFHGVFDFLKAPSPKDFSETEKATEQWSEKNPDGESDSQTGDTETLPHSLYDFDPSTLPDTGTPIRPIDLSRRDAGNSYTINESGVTPGLLTADAMKEYLLGRGELSGRDPLVLIIHTHTTESFAGSESGVCNTGAADFARSDLQEENVVAVGEALAGTLETFGIRTLHCTEVFDSPSCQGAYRRAADTIQACLERYPSIRYVIDVHRDSLTDSRGNLLRAVTEAEGEATAQIMCVVGTGESGEACPWVPNYTLAQSLRCALNELYGNVCRPTLLRASSYNQQYAELSMLLEIGTSGNTLEEAKRAAVLVGKTLAMLLIDEESVTSP